VSFSFVSPRAARRRRRWKLLVATAALLSLAACTTVRIVSPYDEVIDTGLREYRESINVFAKNMADRAGTDTGTYESNKATYNELEVKIDLLIDRAEFSGGGRGCRLTQRITNRIVDVAGDAIPAQLRPDGQSEHGNSLGCTHRLLELVGAQLGLIETSHEKTDRCKSVEEPDGPEISCLRPATAKTALDITNQSINAAWVVEMAKKEGSEE
jgi:hypothetical protein